MTVAKNSEMDETIVSVSQKKELAYDDIILVIEHQTNEGSV